MKLLASDALTTVLLLYTYEISMFYLLFVQSD